METERREKVEELLSVSEKEIERWKNAVRKYEWSGTAYLPDGTTCPMCPSCNCLKMHPTSPHAPDCVFTELNRETTVQPESEEAHA